MLSSRFAALGRTVKGTQSVGCKNCRVRKNYWNSWRKTLLDGRKSKMTIYSDGETDWIIPGNLMRCFRPLALATAALLTCASCSGTQSAPASGQPTAAAEAA